MEPTGHKLRITLHSSVHFRIHKTNQNTCITFPFELLSPSLPPDRNKILLTGRFGPFQFDSPPLLITYFASDMSDHPTSDHSILKLVPLKESILILTSANRLYELCILSKYHPQKIVTLQRHNDTIELCLVEREDIRNLGDVYGNDSLCVGITQDQRELLLWGKSQYLYIPFQKAVESSNSRIMPHVAKLDAKRYLEVEELLSYNEECDDEDAEGSSSGADEDAVQMRREKRKRSNSSASLRGQSKVRTAPSNTTSVIKQIGMGSFYIAFLTTRGDLFVNGLGVSWLSLFCAYKTRKVRLPASPLDPHQSAVIQQIACCDKFMLILIETGELFVWGQVGTETLNEPTLVTIHQRTGSAHLNESTLSDVDSDTSLSTSRSILSLASHEAYAVAISDDGQILGFGRLPSLFSASQDDLNKSQHNNSGGLSRKALLAPTPLYTELQVDLLSKHISVSCGAQHLQILETILTVNDTRFDEQARLIQSLHDQLKQMREERDVSQRRLTERNTQLEQLQDELNSKEQIIMSKNERIKEMQIEQDEQRIRIEELEGVILEMKHQDNEAELGIEDNNEERFDDDDLDIEEQDGEDANFMSYSAQDASLATQLIIDKYRPRDETVNRTEEGTPTPFSPIFDAERHGKRGSAKQDEETKEQNMLSFSP